MAGILICNWTYPRYFFVNTYTETESKDLDLDPRCWAEHGPRYCSPVMIIGFLYLRPRPGNLCKYIYIILFKCNSTGYISSSRTGMHTQVDTLKRCNIAFGKWRKCIKSPFWEKQVQMNGNMSIANLDDVAWQSCSLAFPVGIHWSRLLMLYEIWLNMDQFWIPSDMDGLTLTGTFSRVCHCHGMAR